MKLLNDHQLKVFKEVFERNLYHIIIDDSYCNDREKFKTVLTDLILNYDLQIPENIKYEERISATGIISCFLIPSEALIIQKLPYVSGVESERFANLEK